MSLIARAMHDRDLATEAKLAAEADRLQRQEDIIRARSGIVKQHIQRFAEHEDVFSEELSGTGGARYFVVGDVVLSVRTFGHADRSRLESTLRSDVLWQHYVSLVGIDRTLRTTEYGRCALMTLRYDLVYQAITSNHELEFDYKFVVPVLLSTF